MADLPSPDDLAQAGRAAFRATLDPGGTGAVNLRAGSRNDTAISMMAALVNRVVGYVQDRVSANRLASASGDDLDALAADLYGETRKLDVAATGFVQLTRPPGTATVIPAGSRFAVPATAAQPAVVFIAAQDVPSPQNLSSAIAAYVPVVCAATGYAGNLTSPATQLTSILDALPNPGWSIDSGYMIANPALFVFGGGAPGESDDTFRRRLAQLSPLAERARGTRDAVLAGSLRVAGVEHATLVEPNDGTIVLYVGDAAFALPSALATAVALELQNWRALGVPALVRAYAAAHVPIVATVYLARPLTNYDLTGLRAAMVATLIDYFDARPQPDEYYLDAIKAALARGAPAGQVQHVALAAPAADQPRPADATYGAVTALARYLVDAGDIQLTFAGPTTT